MHLVKKVSISAALIAASVGGHSAVAASTTLYGGGATLPAIAYVGPSFFTSNARLTDPAPAGSLFGSFTALTGVSVSYCQTGSGFGRGVLEGTNNASLPCPSFAVSIPNPSTTYGFSATTMDGNFVASDAPLGSSDYSAFLANQSSRTEPVQFPEVVGSIAVVYNNANVSGQLALTDTQICKVFAGTYTNWNQISSSLPSKAIKLVYRSDGSGTSFGFSNHLSAVCPALGVTGFNTGTSFATDFPGGVAPAGAVGQSGNPNVVTYVLATDGSIGYGETADAIARSSALTYAKVNGFDPKADFASSFKITSSNVLIDTVLGANDANGRPTKVAVTAPVAGCLNLVDPNSYTTTKTYPIIAVSYLMGYYAGNGADAANLQTLLGSGYNNTIKGTTTTIGTGTGFAYISSYNPTKSKRGAPSVLANCITQ